jgi:hypothetical protein
MEGHVKQSRLHHSITSEHGLVVMVEADLLQ